MKSISNELINASSMPIILSVLVNEDTYGYDIIQRVKVYTDGNFVWQEASIYPLLKKMENSGLIKSYWKMSKSERPRKYYTILDEGKKQLEFSKQELQQLNGMFGFLWSPG